MPKRSVETYRVLQPVMFRHRVFKAGRIVTFNTCNAEKFVKAGKMVKVDMTGFVDILKCGLTFPSELVILGSGPNGVSKYGMLEGKFIIALNKAIYAPVKASVWAAQDPTLKREKWFVTKANELQASGRHFGLREFNADQFPMPIVERNNIAKYYSHFKLTFTVSKPLLDARHINVDSPLLHAGGTVCGTFLQILKKLMKKPKPPARRRIILCGIDMFGDVYFDRSKHKDSVRKGRTWYRTSQLDALIKGIIDSGIDVVTVSKTKLKHPTYVEEI